MKFKVPKPIQHRYLNVRWFPIFEEPDPNPNIIQKYGYLKISKVLILYIEILSILILTIIKILKNILNFLNILIILIDHIFWVTFGYSWIRLDVKKN